MVSKQPIFPEGVRQVPKQFSWLDHRLIQTIILNSAPPGSPIRFWSQ